MGRTENALRADVGILAIETVVKCLLFMFVTLQAFLFRRFWYNNRLYSLCHFLSEVLSNKRLQTVDSLPIEQRFDETDLALE